MFFLQKFRTQTYQLKCMDNMIFLIIIIIIIYCFLYVYKEQVAVSASIHPPVMFFSKCLCLLNPNISIKKYGQVAVSASIPPPPGFSLSTCVLLTQTYQLKCMDNMIFLIILLLIIYVFMCLYRTIN